MKRVLTFLLIINIYYLEAEPSVYGSSGGGYQTSHQSSNVALLKRKIARLQEQIDGLKSVIRGLERKVNRLSNRDFSSTASSSSKELEDILYRLNRLEKLVKSKSYTTPTPKKRKKIAQKPKKKEIKTPKEVKKEKRELPKKQTTKKRENKIEVVQKPKKSPKDTPKKKQSPKTEKLSSAELLKKVKDEISKGSYSSAKDNLNLLLRRGYKKAESYFLLGEIAYKEGRFSDAIEFYQKSAERDSDAPYMDRLLLHTAVALKKSGQKEQAKEFFKTVIDTYPNSVSASTAKRYLKAMR